MERSYQAISLNLELESHFTMERSKGGYEATSQWEGSYEATSQWEGRL